VNDYEALDRAGKAKALLGNGLLIEARELVRTAILAKWETAPVRDKEGREYLFLQLKALNDVWAVLEQAVADGKIAEHSIKLKEEEQRRLKLFSFKGRA
jgi:hypothetical protein